MKRGYIKLLIFDILVFIILLLNSFVWNILNGYGSVIFLLIVLGFFKFFLGFEKDKHRYTKDVILEIGIFLLAFFLLYYLLGFFIGFTRINNYYNLNGFFNFILLNIFVIILKECLRYNLLSKAEGNKVIIILSVILFIFFDISNSIYYSDFLSNYDFFVFLAVRLLPAISVNIICSYLAYMVGYKPNIVYLLVVNLYYYLIPIIPNPNEYLLSIINFLLPIVLGYRISKVFNKTLDEVIDRNYNKKRLSPLIFAFIFVVIVVYFTCGYFKYYAVAIASGSMSDEINRGDVVIVEKIFDDYNTLKIGQVIAYKYDNVIVVHRIVDIIEEKNKFYFYTKGDANSKKDNYVVEDIMIVGVVDYRIPFIGIPTVWLNNL